MILFFDTETTGKTNFRAPVNDPSQPYIVQLAAMLTEDDGLERAAMNLIILPDGYIIPGEASAIHGITTEIAQQSGVPILNALSIFWHFLKRAHTLVAHNIDFDQLVMAAALSRVNAKRVEECVQMLETIQKVCTMKKTTDLCRLPGNYGKYKWPKLTEAHKHLFGTELIGGHDAMIDTRACARIYFEINKPIT